MRVEPLRSLVLCASRVPSCELVDRARGSGTGDIAWPRLLDPPIAAYTARLAAMPTTNAPLSLPTGDQTVEIVEPVENLENSRL